MSQFDRTPSFKRTELESPITSHAVVVAADDGELIHAAGTGIFIAQQLIITARHVVMHFWDAIAQRPRPSHRTACNFQIHVLQFPGSHAGPALWAAQRAWIAPFTDVAFLHVVPASKEAEQYLWPGSLRISPLPPPVGERIVGFGYPSSSARLISRTPLQHINWNLQPHTTVGEVTAIFEDQRDRSFLDFPCFETNARFDGGMSGGPLLNSAGELAGIICAALNSDEQGSFTSYGATLWPALVTSVDFEGPGLARKRPYRVWKLSKLGYMHICDWPEVLERIFVERRENGTNRLRLRPSGA